MKQILEKYLQSTNVILILCSVVVFPFLLISVFNNPSADDFCYSNYARDLGYFGLQKEAYFGWSGRYLPTLILGIPNLISGSFVVYKLVPVLLLINLFIAVYHLVSSIFVTLSTKNKCLLAIITVALYLAQMPSPTQGFYWLAGSVTYQLSIILALFMFSYVIRYLTTKNRKFVITAIFLAFFIMGSNEITLVFVNLIIGFAIVYMFFQYRKIDSGMLALFVVMLACSAFVLLSPGSASRATTYPGNQQFMYSVLKTLKATKRHLGDWLPSIIVVLLLFFNSFAKTASKIKTPDVFKVKLFFPVLIVFSFLILGIFPVYYSLKWVPFRVVNLVYFFFLLGVFYVSFILFFKLKEKEKPFIKLSKWTKIALFALVFFRLGGDNNVRVAYSDLFSGKAYAYNKALNERYKIIKQSKDKTVVIPKLTVFPETIFFEDVKPDSKHWINACYNSYFNKSEITYKSKNNRMQHND
ncbi:DUF6056 family protein [Neotamlana laminarinivorans]|uniref:DUF6056 family protein n=1 Tax=Neotamlana laminarinivorans TaxID=2883124 RepID=A0A9X1I0S9_9FLAO|nr:DUF6056 family protein [Tamlana laminarinivorans]MCB4799703.1 DUF6056 family protein [Tamlana laminarinivorans]